MIKNHLYKKVLQMFLIIFPLIFIGLASSCKSVEETYTYEEEMADLANFIQINNITVAPKASGLYYIELKAGTGALAKQGDNVTVLYRGRLITDAVFDSGTFSFVLGSGRVIKGWDEGISYMKKGGTAQLIIPSTMAYGASGASTIPPYSTLIFEVELQAIN